MEKMEESKRLMDKYCRETRAFHTKKLLPFDTNAHGTLFGGRLTSWIDETAAVSVSRHCRAKTMTASIDTLNFLRPLILDHSVCLESFVSGAGTTSMEVFTKVLGENLITGERYLAVTSFWTFVTLRDENGNKIPVPRIIPESEEEIFICQGYEERNRKRMKQLEENKVFGKHLSIELPW